MPDRRRVNTAARTAQREILRRQEVAAMKARLRERLVRLDRILAEMKRHKEALEVPQ